LQLNFKIQAGKAVMNNYNEYIITDNNNNNNNNNTGVLDKSLTRPGRKQATATVDFDVHISHLL
jgi:hypothetical protein